MKKTIATAFIALSIVGQASASWTTFPLPSTTSPFDNTTIAHLADGRYIYGHSGSLVRQDAFGSAAYSSFTSDPAGDYSFVTGQHLGTGGWAAPYPIYSYDAGNLSNAFSSISTNYQSYAALDYDASSLLVVGANGTGGRSALGHLTTSGTYTQLIADISNFSSGFAMDSLGNVYIGDNDDQNIYRFTASQIAASVAGTSLNMLDGQFVANLGVTGSIAVDSATNMLYAAGYQTSGIRVFDMTSAQTDTIVPGASNTNYQVHSFSNGTDNYIGWINRSGWNGGDTVTYGYSTALQLAIPEPSTNVLFALGGLLVLTPFVRKCARS